MQDFKKCTNYNFCYHSAHDRDITNRVPVTYQVVMSGMWDMHSGLPAAVLQSKFGAEDDHIQEYGKGSVTCECPQGTQDNSNEIHSLHTIKLETTTLKPSNTTAYLIFHSFV